MKFRETPDLVFCSVLLLLSLAVPLRLSSISCCGQASFSLWPLQILLITIRTLINLKMAHLGAS